MTPLTKTEIRWRDGTNTTRYLKDGETIRCQAVAKQKLRAIRVQRGYSEDDTTITADEVWPEAQCEHPAVPGKLVCGGRAGHGGNSMSVPYHDLLLGSMPVDLREKMEILMDNPEILSRRLEMVELSARNLQLFEEMRDSEKAGSDLDSKLREAMKFLKSGDYTKASNSLQEVLEYKGTQQKRWDEIRANTVILKDLSRTETNTIQAFRQMISSEQFLGALMGIADAVKDAVEKYINEPTVRNEVIGHVYSSIRRLTNARIGGVQPTLIGDGSGEDG
jgi:hypothetical protein